MKRRMEEPRQTNISQRWSEAPLQTWIARYNFCFAGDMEYEAKSVIAGGTGTSPRETRLSRPERLVSFHEMAKETGRSMCIATIYQHIKGMKIVYSLFVPKPESFGCARAC